MSELPAWIPLWPEGAPLARGSADHDTPAIRHFVPTAPANGAAMLVLPGGGYGALAAHEGEAFCRWWAGLGYHAYELRYRLAPHGYRHPAMWMDATRAMRMVRSLAPEAGFVREKVGIIGCSAGGHLAGHVTVKNDGGDPGAADSVERESSRPALSVLCYAVISMSSETMHRGSRHNLLGENVPEALGREMSHELQVSPSTPPCFLWHTLEDAVVPMENSVDFAMALRRAGVRFELHLYEKCGHGIGLANGHPWTRECARWVGETFASLPEVP